MALKNCDEGEVSFFTTKATKGTRALQNKLEGMCLAE
jgi:hypothetical protein